jgi:hypothetical protein
MALSTISAGNQVTDFQKKTNKEYVRDGRFGPYIGASENAIIQTNKNIRKKSIPLIGKLSAAGVRGSTQLTGAEEALSNYDFDFTPTHVRNGVLIDQEEREKSEFDLYQEAKPALKNWIMELKRDQIIQALGAIEAGGTYYNYGGSEASGAVGSSAASAANMDTYQAANADRIVYGSAVGNLTSGDHTTSLGTIDATDDRLDTEALELIKRVAADADPLIRPVMLNGDEPFYVYFVGKYGFRDLRNSTAMQSAMREALPRMKTNPLFSGGDLYWDGMIIKEVPDMDKFIDSAGSGLWDGVWGANATGDGLNDAGATASRVGVGFLCGAQAIVFGRGKNATFARRKEDDYGHLAGVGLTCKHDIKKIFYNGKQHGMLTHFHSAPLDA